MSAYAGPAFVFVGCTWLGFALSARLKRKERAAARLEAQFLALSNYIARLYMPLPQALALCGDEMKAASDYLEKNPSAGVCEALTAAFEGAGLEKSDMDELLMWANIMQSMRREDCESVMKGAVEAAKNMRSRASEAARKDSALFRALGACLGAALAVLML